MLTTLAVPYADTAPADLCFALDHPVLPALAVLEVPASAGIPALQLRLLGASHQAVLEPSDANLVETLACLPGESGGPLPTRHDAAVAGLIYQFTLEILRPTSAVEFIREVASVRDRVGRARYGLTGVFPGDDDAVTALLAEPAVGQPAARQPAVGQSAGSAAPVRTAASVGTPTTPGQLAWTTWHAYPGTGDLVRTHSTVRPAGLSPTQFRGSRQ